MNPRWGGGGGGHKPAHAFSPVPLEISKKTPFEASQAPIKTSCQNLKNDAEMQNVTCYSVTVLSFVPAAKMERY